MFKKICNAVLPAVFILSFVSCEDDPENPPPGASSNLVTITEDITDPTTWYADSVYLIRAWDFYVENTLTIQAGTVVKFHPADGPYLYLSGAGTIIAKGTASKPIIFTSYKDDAHGGDLNGDGNSSTPARKDWGEINTNGNNGSVFEYCHFLYGGQSTYSATLSIESGSVASVKNCLFAHNDGSDGSGWYGALDLSGCGNGSQVSGNTFYDNIRPLSINTYPNIDNSNIFHNPEDAEQTNQYNAIFVETIDDLTQAVSWQETEVAFVIDDNDWWINSGASLTLANEVVLKFRPASVLLLADGPSAIVNRNGTGVFFTSYKDDSRKGDSNGDGNATMPGASDWGGIYDDVTGNYVNWANIYYDSK